MIMLVLGALAEEPRPILGIGVGLRGDGDGADFVASARVRTSETFVVEPSVAVSYDQAQSASDYDGDLELDDEAQAATDLRAEPEFTLRGRVGRRGQVSGWLFARVSATYVDEITETSSWPGDQETGDDDTLSHLTQRHFSFAGGCGFATELFLRPEVALSADLGANLLGGSWSWAVTAYRAPNEEGTAMDEWKTHDDYGGLGVGFEPYAQLAIHLYY